jgi:ParB family chromosome partitioning protein
MIMPASETATGKATATEEFQNIPIEPIVVEKQIRTGVNVDGEDFQGFVASVDARGIVEPVVVAPREDNRFRLIAGELRYRAGLKLGLVTIPARILRNVQSEEEVLTIQLIENLQRWEIDPIDKANGILAFFRNRHGEMAVSTVMNDLILHERADQRVSNEVVETVSTISKITGITPRSIQIILSLLILPPKIRDAVKTGAVPVSQGYILAANLVNPGS